MKMKSPKFNSEPPRTLKDFLSADSAIANKALPRSPSTRIPAFHALLTALKNFHFSATVKSSSKRTPTLCGGGHRETPQRPQIKLNSLTIKDIIRWKSFRDLPEQDTSPQTAITTTSSATSSPCGSSGSSWCGSDFTAEYLPWWRDGNSEENGEGEGKKCLPRVGEEKAEAVTKTKSEVGPESPISVMENIFEEECCSSSYDQQYFTVEAINLEKWMSTAEKPEFEEEEEMEDIEVEEKAWKLFNDIANNQTISSNTDYEESEKRVVMDFIKEELIRNEVFDNEEMVIRRVREWINGEDKLWRGWDKKEGYIREMETNGRWNNKYEEEQQELGLDIQNSMVDFLVDELVLDLITSNL